MIGGEGTLRVGVYEMMRVKDGCGEGSLIVLLLFLC